MNNRFCHFSSYGSCLLMVFGNKPTPFSSIRVVHGKDARDQKLSSLVLDTLVHIFAHP